MKRVGLVAAVLGAALALAEPAGTPRGRSYQQTAVAVSEVVADIAGQDIAPRSVTTPFVDAGNVTIAEGGVLRLSPNKANLYAESTNVIATGAGATNANFTVWGTLRAYNDIRPPSAVYDGTVDIGNGSERFRNLYTSAGVLTAAVYEPVAASIDGGISLPRIQWGIGTLTANALAVTFSPAFGTAPSCRCSHVSATPISCGPAAQASTTAVTFNVPAGTGTVNWECIGDK